MGMVYILHDRFKTFKYNVKIKNTKDMQKYGVVY